MQGPRKIGAAGAFPIVYNCKQPTTKRARWNPFSAVLDPGHFVLLGPFRPTCVAARRGAVK